MYIKQNFTDGQVLTAAQLDAMENGILEAQDLTGITPAIGENGNWYIGATDTGYPARGERGATPVKGTDYFTPEDTAELVQQVLDALPNGDEVSY